MPFTLPARKPKPEPLMKEPNRVVIVSGGFDPIHSGHIALFKGARDLAGVDGTLIAGINSDDWLTKKKGAPFMPLSERKAVLSSIRYIDDVQEFDDSDGTANNLIKQVRYAYPNDMIVFANGGDRTSNNIPELAVAEDYRVSYEFGVGGNYKLNSSSWILEQWKKTEKHPKSKFEIYGREYF